MTRTPCVKSNNKEVTCGSARAAVAHAYGGRGGHTQLLSKIVAEYMYWE